MPVRRNGYDPYRGRGGFRTALKVFIGVLIAVLVLAVAALIWLEPYIGYSIGGIRIRMPFFHREEPAETGGAPVVVTTPTAAPLPAPTPSPEQPEEFRAVLLPASALSDGTAQAQAEAAGAGAVLFDMKADDGSLGYVSALEQAAQAGASAGDPARNEAIRQLNGGEVYTVARVSCFRDNALPYFRNSLALHVSGGNWRDAGGSRWLSPASAEARQYVAGVCRELAELGFDEILLDNWSFPLEGAGILEDENGPALGRTGILEDFLDQVKAAVADYPEVRLSLVTTGAAAAGQAAGSGQTTALLERAHRVVVRLEEGEALPALEDVSVTAAADRPGEPEGSWVVLPAPGTF